MEEVKKRLKPDIRSIDINKLLTDNVKMDMFNLTVSDNTHELRITSYIDCMNNQQKSFRELIYNIDTGKVVNETCCHVEGSDHGIWMINTASHRYEHFDDLLTIRQYDRLNWITIVSNKQCELASYDCKKCDKYVYNNGCVDNPSYDTLITSNGDILRLRRPRICYIIAGTSTDGERVWYESRLDAAIHMYRLRIDLVNKLAVLDYLYSIECSGEYKSIMSPDNNLLFIVNRTSQIVIHDESKNKIIYYNQFINKDNPPYHTLYLNVTNDGWMYYSTYRENGDTFRILYIGHINQTEVRAFKIGKYMIHSRLACNDEYLVYRNNKATLELVSTSFLQSLKPVQRTNNLDDIVISYSIQNASSNPTNEELKYIFELYYSSNGTIATKLVHYYAHTLPEIKQGDAIIIRNMSCYPIDKEFINNTLLLLNNNRIRLDITSALCPFIDLIVLRAKQSSYRLLHYSLHENCYFNTPLESIVKINDASKMDHYKCPHHVFHNGHANDVSGCRLKLMHLIAYSFVPNERLYTTFFGHKLFNGVPLSIISSFFQSADDVYDRTVYGSVCPVIVYRLHRVYDCDNIIDINSIIS